MYSTVVRDEASNAPNVDSDNWKLTTNRPGSKKEKVLQFQVAYSRRRLPQSPVDGIV